MGKVLGDVLARKGDYPLCKHLHEAPVVKGVVERLEMAGSRLLDKLNEFGELKLDSN